MEHRFLDFSLAAEPGDGAGCVCDIGLWVAHFRWDFFVRFVHLGGFSVRHPTREFHSDFFFRDGDVCSSCLETSDSFHALFRAVPFALFEMRCSWELRKGTRVRPPPTAWGWR